MRFMFLFVLLSSLFACKPALLPKTEIPASADNKIIYDIIETYRLSMENKDKNTILSLISKDYFENGGTEVPDDDFGYEGFKDRMDDYFSRIKVIRLDLHYNKINVDRDKAVVDYRYKQRAHIQFPSGDKWISDTDVKRIILRKEGNTWKIMSGL